MTLSPLSPLLTEPLVRAALLEDLGRAGDITTDAVIPRGTTMRALMVTREAGVLAGLDLAEQAFRLMGPGLSITRLQEEGAPLEAGMAVLRVEGAARAILSAERVALNFTCRLSGIASATAKLVAAARGHGHARITCTRKTTPGLRAVEKYAVRAGGGANHRFGLDDAVLIKDNHIAVAGGIRPAVTAARAQVGHLVRIEVEADTLAQVDEAVSAGADVILLDNMGPDMLRAAVTQVAGRAVTEASGRVTLDSVPAIAASGVDLISCGWLTHSAPILDLGLDVDLLPS